MPKHSKGKQINTPNFQACIEGQEKKKRDKIPLQKLIHAELNESYLQGCPPALYIPHTEGEQKNNDQGVSQNSIS